MKIENIKQYEDEDLITPEIRERCKDLILDDDTLREIQRRFLDNINRGLRKDTHDEAIIKCFVTYVQNLPSGEESGKFLALDLGGTNFRVLLIELSKNHFEMKSKIFAIPQHIMLGSGERLFDHIADCLYKFTKEENIVNEVLPLGFTFSFPLVQKSLTTGILKRWTKGFNCSNVVGQDVVQLLLDAIERRGDIKISVMAILNDSTGTLMSCAWLNRNCRIGLIVGTGSNACYVEKQKNAELFDGEDLGSGNVLINTEWGAFGDDGALDFVRTCYDEEIDRHSVNPGKQLHEKMISGMYMGELARLALEKLTKEGLLFSGKGSDALFTRGSFYTKYVSEIESDRPGTYSNCIEILEELGLKHATEQDYINVRFICECVSRRAAHLVSAAVAGLLNKMGEKKVTIGIDGSVYRYHPHFHNLMMEKIGNLTEPGIVYDLMLSEDGSGRGAALVAAVACRHPR
ncbi:hexokinase type 2 isoform X1 [Harmonia axyridis]|uniref:hexokinase type 2 isoform X1 n=1 Tax=Harmonia axyridis TaxID=115357 RepID=UPI001E275D64|nr:hexokinase type 2 isoform X1 [Harmonia axyridis]